MVSLLKQQEVPKTWNDEYQSALGRNMGLQQAVTEGSVGEVVVPEDMEPGGCGTSQSTGVRCAQLGG